MPHNISPLSLHDALPILVGAPRLPRDEPRGLNVPIEKVPPGLVLRAQARVVRVGRSEEHTSELQSHHDIVCRLVLEKKKVCWCAVSYVAHHPDTTQRVLR